MFKQLIIIVVFSLPCMAAISVPVVTYEQDGYFASVDQTDITKELGEESVENKQELIAILNSNYYAFQIKLSLVLKTGVDHLFSDRPLYKMSRVQVNNNNPIIVVLAFNPSDPEVKVLTISHVNNQLITTNITCITTQNKSEISLIKGFCADSLTKSGITITEDNLLKAEEILDFKTPEEIKYII